MSTEIQLAKNQHFLTLHTEKFNSAFSKSLDMSFQTMSPKATVEFLQYNTITHIVGYYVTKLENKD